MGVEEEANAITKKSLDRLIKDNEQAMEKGHAHLQKAKGSARKAPTDVASIRAEIEKDESKKPVDGTIARNQERADREVEAQAEASSNAAAKELTSHGGGSGASSKTSRLF